MKSKIFISVIFILLSLSDGSGQSTRFTYDDNGNRTSKITVEPLQHVMSSRSLSTSDKSQALQSNKTQEMVLEETKSDNGEINPLVYPNPNKGLIRIEVPNMPSNSNCELRIYDLSGNELMIKKDFKSYNEIDISQYRDGTYILRMKINELVFNWKVIKLN
jgi:myo-inositol-hexaphosphate 3-phosphohydrolase